MWRACRCPSSWWRRGMTTSTPLLPTLTSTSLPATSSSGSPPAPCASGGAPPAACACLVWICQWPESAALTCQEPVDALEADCAVPGGDHRHLRGRDHHWCAKCAWLGELLLLALVGETALEAGGTSKRLLWAVRRHAGVRAQRQQPARSDLTMSYSFKGKNFACQGSQKYRMR